jgi:hypothetical protein
LTSTKIDLLKATKSVRAGFVQGTPSSFLSQYNFKQRFIMVNPLTKNPTFKDSLNNPFIHEIVKNKKYLTIFQKVKKSWTENVGRVLTDGPV